MLHTDFCDLSLVLKRLWLADASESPRNTGWKLNMHFILRIDFCDLYSVLKIFWIFWEPKIGHRSLHVIWNIYFSKYFDLPTRVQVSGESQRITRQKFWTTIDNLTLWINQSIDDGDDFREFLADRKFMRLEPVAFVYVIWNT